MSLKLPYQVSHHRCWVSSCSVWCRVVHCTLVHSPVTGSSHAGSWGTRAQPPGNESGLSRRGPEENTEKRMRRLSHCNHLFTALSPLQHKYGNMKRCSGSKRGIGSSKGCQRARIIFFLLMLDFNYLEGIYFKRERLQSSIQWEREHWTE